MSASNGEPRSGHPRAAGPSRAPERSKANPESIPRLGAAFEARTHGHLRTTAERTLKLRLLDPTDAGTIIGESERPTGVEASPPSTQPCFTIGHSPLLRGRAASSAGTVASSLR